MIRKRLTADQGLCAEVALIMVLILLMNASGFYSTEIKFATNSTSLQRIVTLLCP